MTPSDQPAPDPDDAPSADFDPSVSDLLSPVMDAESLRESYTEGIPFAEGAYLLGQPLGAGATGRVFKSLCTATVTEVAVKILYGHHFKDEPQQERFQAEVDLLQACSHPHVLVFLGSGEAEGTCYLVTEVMGGSVKRWLGPSLPMTRILSWMLAACAALRHLHSQGILHGDLKPSNFLLTADGLTLKLGDFGAARRVVGLGETDDRLSVDIHGLGTAFFCMLTGKEPLMGHRSTVELAQRDPFCDVICQKASTDDGASRYRNVAAFEADLVRLKDRLENPPLQLQKRPLSRPAAATAVAILATGAWFWKKPSPPPAHHTPQDTAGLTQLASLTPAASPEAASVQHPFVIPGGHYFLPVPQHPGVLLAATEITRSQFRPYAATLDLKAQLHQIPKIIAFDGTGLTQSSKTWLDTCPLPADAAGGISATAADQYCQWLTKQEISAGRIPPTAYFRLPWASEWLAVQGSLPVLTNLQVKTPLYVWGDTWPPPENTGNFAGLETLADPLRPRSWLPLSRTDNFLQVAPVGSFPPNQLGFYDIDGNLYEWAWEPPTDKSKPGSPRVVMGNSWQSGDRIWHPMEMHSDSVFTAHQARGFRLLLEYAPPTKPRFLSTLCFITDCSGTPDSSTPGARPEKFTVGDRIRITWRVENHGAPGSGALGHNARAGIVPGLDVSHGTTMYRSRPSQGRPALGGGTQRSFTHAKGEGGFFSFDMDTTGWPLGRVDISSSIRENEAADALMIESSTPGAGIGHMETLWWLEMGELLPPSP